MITQTIEGIASKSFSLSRIPETASRSHGHGGHEVELARPISVSDVQDLDARGFQPDHVARFAQKVVKRVVVFALAIWFVPWVLLAYLACGALDVARNRRRTLATIDRYFAGNGVFTWLLSPFYLFIDLLCLPYRNHGIYKLADLPEGHQKEINALIEAAYRRDVVGQLSVKSDEFKRGMVLFK